MLDKPLPEFNDQHEELIAKLLSRPYKVPIEGYQG